MGYSLGVDLGTSFVAAAVARGDRAEMCPLGEHARVCPAVVFLTEDGETLTGDPALRRGLATPDRMARDIRRRLGEPDPLLLGGHPHPVPELLGTLLRTVVATVTASEGAAPEQVVLTHPAGWGPARQEAFATVPALAGLPDAVLLTEPEAVAAHYAATRPLPEGGPVALYSLGGGTFEVTLARPGPDGLEFVGPPHCLERLGGLDFDEVLIDHVDRLVGGAVGAMDPADPGTERALARLREECVQAKEALSGDDEAIVAVLLGAQQRDVVVTRADFERLIGPMLERTVDAVRQALAASPAGGSELAGTLLVGGSTRIPLVARMLRQALGRPVWTNVHPKHAVALGAALAAARLPARSPWPAPPAALAAPSASLSAPPTLAAPSAPPSALAAPSTPSAPVASPSAPSAPPAASTVPSAPAVDPPVAEPAPAAALGTADGTEPGSGQAHPTGPDPGATQPWTYPSPEPATASPATAPDPPSAAPPYPQSAAPPYPPSAAPPYPQSAAQPYPQPAAPPYPQPAAPDAPGPPADAADPTMFAAPPYAQPPAAPDAPGPPAESPDRSAAADAQLPAPPDPSRPSLVVTDPRLPAVSPVPPAAGPPYPPQYPPPGYPAAPGPYAPYPYAPYPPQAQPWPGQAWPPPPPPWPGPPPGPPPGGGGRRRRGRWLIGIAVLLVVLVVLVALVAGATMLVPRLLGG